MSQRPTLLDAHGRPIARRSRGPATFAIRCAICHAPYETVQTSRGPVAQETCTCRTREDPKAPSMWDLMGGRLSGWLGFGGSK